MPTHQELPRFKNDYSRLSEDQRKLFRFALRLFLAGLPPGQFDPKLRVKRVSGYGSVWELTWAADGRATSSTARP